jgi:tRNA G37 N-methylase Trm5
VATDIRQLTDNLRAFRDLAGRVVLSVGTGGGQFLDLYRDAARIVAVDSDPAALRQLEAAVAARGLRERVELVQADFFEVARSAEVVVFEFCLHEMPDPAMALERARSLAPEVLVYDHVPGSTWAWHAAEEAKVQRSTQAMEECGIRRRAEFHGEQRFRDYAELQAKLASQGPTAIDRAAPFRERQDIVIPMTYLAALLQPPEARPAAHFTPFSGPRRFETPGFRLPG